MSPKEKAKELYDYYDLLCRDFTKGVSIKEFSKLCAIKAVDEVLSFVDARMQGWLDVDWIAYLEEVKIEINRL